MIITCLGGNWIENQQTHGSGPLGYFQSVEIVTEKVNHDMWCESMTWQDDHSSWVSDSTGWNISNW